MGASSAQLAHGWRSLARMHLYLFSVHGLPLSSSTDTELGDSGLRCGSPRGAQPCSCVVLGSSETLIERKLHIIVWVCAGRTAASLSAMTRVCCVLSFGWR
eukprot:122140-Prymnesium_polylepis.2